MEEHSLVRKSVRQLVAWFHVQIELLLLDCFSGHLGRGHDVEARAFAIDPLLGSRLTEKVRVHRQITGLGTVVEIDLNVDQVKPLDHGGRWIFGIGHLAGLLLKGEQECLMIDGNVMLEKVNIDAIDIAKRAHKLPHLSEEVQEAERVEYVRIFLFRHCLAETNHILDQGNTVERVDEFHPLTPDLFTSGREQRPGRHGWLTRKGFIEK